MKQMKKPNTIKHNRLLYFFKIYRRDDPDKTPTGTEIVTALNSLPVQERFIKLPNSGNRLSFVDFGSDEGRQRVILTTCRRFWSKIQEGAQLKDLTLKSEQDLAETSHMVIFDDGHVGIEFNQHGPKMSQFEALINARCPGLGVVKFLTCMRKESKDRISKNRVLKRMKLRIWKADIGQIRPKPLRESLLQTMNALDIDDLEIIVRNPRNDKSSFEKVGQKLIGNLLGYRATNPAHQPVLKAEAIDEHGIKYGFGLFASQISMRKNISFEDDESSRYIDSTAWFNTIVAEKGIQDPILKEAVYAEIMADDDE